MGVEHLKDRESTELPHALNAPEEFDSETGLAIGSFESNWSVEISSMLEEDCRDMSNGIAELGSHHSGFIAISFHTGYHVFNVTKSSARSYHFLFLPFFVAVQVSVYVFQCTPETYCRLSSSS